MHSLARSLSNAEKIAPGSMQQALHALGAICSALLGDGAGLCTLSARALKIPAESVTLRATTGGLEHEGAQHLMPVQTAASGRSSSLGSKA